MARKIRNGIPKYISFRVKESEYKTIHAWFKKSTSRKLSTYARNVLLQKPVTVYYRNQTADDFLAEMILLKKELNAIGNNFNQVVHRLHTLDHVPQVLAWVKQNEISQQEFQQKVDEILRQVNAIYEVWSQK